MTETYKTPLKELLFKMADDELIIGHRNSEWTGLGPFLEEDIAFSSIAQDKLGQSQVFYKMLNELGEPEPDSLAFNRNSSEFKCCRYVEHPIGEYNFSLMRNFLFNHAEHERFSMLENSSYEQISSAAKKIRGEVKYHIMHADTWINQLGNASGESNSLLQASLNESFDLALGIFEKSPYEGELLQNNIFAGEDALKTVWLEKITSILESSSLKIPDESRWSPVYGGRNGKHSEYLQPLLDEMSEVFKIDPKAEW